MSSAELCILRDRLVSLADFCVFFPSADAFGSDALKERYLPDLARGKTVGCFVSLVSARIEVGLYFANSCTRAVFLGID